MSTPDVYGYLLTKGQWRRSGVEAIGICPACHGGQKGERTLSVNTDSGQWICNRQTNCGQTGNLRDLERLYGDGQARPKVLPFPTNYAPPMHNAKAIKADGLAFLASRGITEHTASVWRIGQEGDWLAWPVYDPAGKLVNVKTRNLKEKRFLNKKGTARWPIGLHRVHAANGKRLIITEGELDAMTAEQYGLRNVISLPNGSGDQDWIALAWDWLRQFDEIVLATDADEAGAKAKAEIVRRLGADWCHLSVTLPGGHKDLNACLMAGVEAAEIAAAFEVAAEIKPSNIHTADHYTDAVIALFEDVSAINGTRSRIGRLDQLLRGFRPAELTVWTGQSGSGKSTVLGQLALNWGLDGVKTCVASLELKPANYLRWITMQATAQGMPERSRVRAALSWIGTRLVMIDHVGGVDLADLIGWFDYCGRRYGCKQFVCDSLQLVKAGADELKGQKEIVTQLLGLAHRLGAHVHLVAHPRKGETDDAAPGKVDVRGSGSITDLAHNVITVHRGTAGNRLIVSKNREHGVLGDAMVRVDADCKQVFDTIWRPNFESEINQANDYGADTIPDFHQPQTSGSDLMNAESWGL